VSIFDGTTGEDPVPPATMPAMTPPPAIVPKPGWQGGIHGLFDRIEEGAKTAAKNIPSNLMPTPDALKGLLSDQDVSTARRAGLLQLGIALSQGHGENPLQSLGRGLAAAQQGFHDHVAGVIDQKHQADEEMQRQRLLQQQTQLLQSRASIARQFAAPPNETPDQTDDRLRKMAVAYANSNDPEMATKVGGLVKDLKVTPGALHTINTGANQVTVDDKGNTIRTAPTPPRAHRPGSRRVPRRRSSRRRSGSRTPSSTTSTTRQKTTTRRKPPTASSPPLSSRRTTSCSRWRRSTRSPGC
jgi:hypothetical protein